MLGWAGESRVLVVRGDPGGGKTVLLDYLAERARGCRIARAAGVQSEMELAFAGLHQLCAPMLDHLDRIPVPQRDALLTGDPARRAGRALAAAQGKVQAGASGAAQGLLAIAETGPLSDLEEARLELVRALLASATSRDAEARCCCCGLPNG